MKRCRLFFLVALLVSLLLGSVSAQDIVPVKGTYYGLFAEPDGAWDQSSGAIVICTSSRGSYTASLQRGRYFYRFSGHFDASGSDSRRIISFFAPALTVELQISPDDVDIISGTVSDGVWVADLFADRAVFDGRANVSPDAGKYTMVLPGDITSSTTPGGDGFATITVDRAGRLRVSGEQADVWGFFQCTRVSKDGLWPFYFPAYRGRGTLHGWLQLNAVDSAAVSGDVTWVKPHIWDWYYPDGFALMVSATGSQYVPPAQGTPIIDMESGTLELNGGNLNEGITNSVILDANSRIHNQGPNDLKLKFSLSNGFFKGSIANPNSRNWIPFRGVVLQDRAVGAGYFPGWDQTGEVLLQGD
jgi:hypothetical protein